MSLLNSEIPVIDPRVEYVGASKLRTLNYTNLSKLKKTLVIQDPNNDTPLAVLLNYEQYLIIQNKFNALLKTIELLQSSNDAKGVVTGAKDAVAGETIPLAEIRKGLKG